MLKHFTATDVYVLTGLWGASVIMTVLIYCQYS